RRIRRSTLEEEEQVCHEEGTESESGESSAPSAARTQGSTGRADGETEREAGAEGNFGEPRRSGSARRAESQCGSVDGGSGFGRPMESLLHFGFARGDAKGRTATDERGGSRR